ncbi:MAG: hypothetical protein J4O03_11600 [Chloroflexi bacterium]|nr:hypothetical protein [Chloroflexota bacterium]MCI0780747.1 hypothetical protein [Chloroflexota bacterium]MCI0785935.1 hypothetical protein [Chloroflexota bacterium]MCI0794099.1 hypothetical protein [Chloroflexota bacterium]MCI0798351.1 hypothetical protein [Chloroflexota bacterium]
MTIKVARVPYLSYEPFYFDMERRGLQLFDLLPNQVAEAAESGHIDAGPIPLVDSFRLEDKFQPVAGFCVSVSSRAGSSLLCSHHPIQDLKGATIGIPAEAATSPHLLQVLLNLKYKISPGAFVTAQESPDALLLTGDPALRRRRGIRGYPHTYDLGEEWNQWTGLPFVFSRWMARKDMDQEEAALLEDTLYVGLEDGVDGLYHLSEPRPKLLMLAKDIMEYIQGFRYFIGYSEQKAIDRFREYLKQINPEGL